MPFNFNIFKKIYIYIHSKEKRFTTKHLNYKKAKNCFSRLKIRKSNQPEDASRWSSLLISQSTELEKWAQFPWFPRIKAAKKENKSRQPESVIYRQAVVPPENIRAGDGGASDNLGCHIELVLLILTHGEVQPVTLHWMPIHSLLKK